MIGSRSCLQVLEKNISLLRLYLFLNFQIFYGCLIRLLIRLFCLNFVPMNDNGCISTNISWIFVFWKVQILKTSYSLKQYIIKYICLQFFIVQKKLIIYICEHNWTKKQNYFSRSLNMGFIRGSGVVLAV